MKNNRHSPILLLRPGTRQSGGTSPEVVVGDSHVRQLWRDRASWQRWAGTGANPNRKGMGYQPYVSLSVKEILGLSTA